MSETATKQQIEHTPTPWRVGEHPRDNSGSQWREILTDATEYAPSYVGQALGVDAAFIVRAVNSHEALILAVRNALEKVFNDGKRPGWVEIQQSAIEELRAALSATQEQ